MNSITTTAHEVPVDVAKILTEYGDQVAALRPSWAQNKTEPIDTDPKLFDHVCGFQWKHQLNLNENVVVNLVRYDSLHEDEVDIGRLNICARIYDNHEIDFDSIDQMREAATSLNRAANEFEKLLAEQDGLRIFDIGGEAHSSEFWWVCEQRSMWQGREFLRVFAVGTDSKNHGDMEVGSTWGDSEHQHVVIAKARVLSTFEKGGDTITRFVEVKAD